MIGSTRQIQNLAEFGGNPPEPTDKHRKIQKSKIKKIDVPGCPGSGTPFEGSGTSPLILIVVFVNEIMQNHNRISLCFRLQSARLARSDYV